MPTSTIPSYVTIPNLAANGTTDDAAALQAALNETTPGGAVLLPAAPVALSKPLALPPSVHLWMLAGGVLRAIASMGAMIAAQGVAATYGTGLHGINLDGAGLAAHGIDASYLNTFAVEDVTISNCTSHGLYIADSITAAPAPIIRNLRVAANGGDGVHLGSSYGAQITQGYSLKNGGSGLYLCGGECEAFGWQSDQDSDRGIFVNNANRTQIVGCSVSQNAASNGSSIEIRTSSHCSIQARVLGPASSPYNYFAFYVVGSSAHTTLHGCVVEDAGPRTNFRAAYAFSDSKGCLLSGSIGDCVNGQAIWEDAGCSGNRYSGNVLNAAQPSTLGGGGVVS